MTAGGTNLRGYLYQQFRGDTQMQAKVEYHFPLFSIGPLDFRALGFYDSSAILVPRAARDRRTRAGIHYTYQTADRRRPSCTFAGARDHTPIGFTFDSNIHTAVGGGLRFFLRSVAVPLVGFDAGYGIEARTWRFILIVGA